MILFSTISGRLVLTNSETIVHLIIRWDEKTGMDVFAQGEKIATSSDPLTYLRVFAVVPLKAPAGTTPYDFSANNASAVTKRSGHYTELIRNPSPDFGGLEYLVLALVDEIAILRSALAEIRFGSVAHVRGLAARLRVLIHRDGQIPLLQTCAGALDVPLTVYGQHNPKIKLPTVASAQSLVGLTLRAISAAPVTGLRNPIDLDVWLGLTAIWLGDVPLSNAKILADLGNTIGNHFDPNIAPIVRRLREHRFEYGGASADGIAVYVSGVAEAVLALSEKVVAASKAQQTDAT